jgi:hypothetical protein
MAGQYFYAYFVFKRAINITYDIFCVCIIQCMTDSIGDLLQNRRIEEPPEIKIIQEFVESKYHLTPQVMVNQQQIVIGVKSAALAGTLRPQLPQIKDLCQTDKRLVIRIQ